jgi:very-short-patch-repair endonuclease
VIQRINPPLPSQSRDFARDLRLADNAAEQKLWYHLRAGRLLDRKFRRQHPIPPYIVDFICLSEKLVVELDGSQHTESRDAQRTAFLEAKGLRVLRFWGNDALNRTVDVLEAIVNAFGSRTLTPTPLPRGEGL